MKKILLLTFFIGFVMFSYSQRPKELTYEEKQELREKHKATMQFNNNKAKEKANARATPKNNRFELKTTNEVQQSDDHVKTTVKVQHFSGKKDKKYNKFEYKKD